jgi:tetratricopeptide (TPR) repeat protein
VQEDPAQARAYYRQALEIYAAVGDRLGETTCMDNLGTTYWAQGNYTRAREIHRRVLAIRQQIADRRGEGATRVKLAIQAHYLGDFETAERGYQQALALYREIGYRRGEGEVLGHLCLLRDQQGEHATACGFGQQAVQLARDIGDPSDLGYALTFLGYALEGAGQAAQAAEAYAEALRLRQALAERNRAMEPLAGLARIALIEGDLELALRRAEQILDHLAAGSLAVTDQPIRVYLTCYDVLQARDDPRAPAILAEGRRQLQAMADLISDASERRVFLEASPAHRALLAAAARIGSFSSTDGTDMSDSL